MPLSDFAKGIANHITLRTDFTRYFIEHPTINKIFSENNKLNSEDEKMLIRLLILLKNGINVSLTPQDLERHYDNFTKQELLKYREQVTNCLNLIEPCVEKLQGFRSIRSYSPLICYIIIHKQPTKEEIEKFFIAIKEANFSGRGDDQHPTTVINRYNTLLKLLN